MNTDNVMTALKRIRLDRQKYWPEATRASDPITSHLAEAEITESGKRKIQADMILEAVDLHIRAGQSKAFEAAFKRALPLVQSIDGYIACELQRCIDQHDRYLLLIHWDTLQAHTQGFRLSPQYVQ